MLSTTEDGARSSTTGSEAVLGAEVDGDDVDGVAAYLTASSQTFVAEAMTGVLTVVG